MVTKRKTNYLNNKDLLEQIHRSKMSWCYFPYKDDTIKGRRNNYQQKYNRFDYAQVLNKDGSEDLSLLKDEAKLTIILNEKRRKAAKEGDNTPYTMNDLVIRINSYQHIPYLTDYDPDKTYQYIHRKHEKINFVPFKHYAMIDGEWQAVVISHHNDDNEFDPFAGKVTNEMALMFMKFVEKISKMSKYRNYSYNEEFIAQALQQLSAEGLKFDEAKVNVSKYKQLNPFAYLQTTIENSFIKVINDEKKHQILRDNLLEHNNLLPSMSRQMENGSDLYDESRAPDWIKNKTAGQNQSPKK